MKPTVSETKMRGRLSGHSGRTVVSRVANSLSATNTSEPVSARISDDLPRVVGRIAVARSVDNDDDARWLAQRLHRSIGSSVDVNPRLLGWSLLVIGAGPVEPSIAQHNAALGENGALQFCDSLSIGPIR
jgi:hypothetical protein